MHHRNLWTWALAALLCVFLLAGLAGCSKESKKENHFKKGEAYLAENKFREAVIEFKNVLQIAPNDAKAQLKLGMAQLGAGDPHEAYAALSKAIELDPNSLEARVQLGRIFLMAREPEKAREQARGVQRADRCVGDDEDVACRHVAGDEGCVVEQASTDHDRIAACAEVDLQRLRGVGRHGSTPSTPSW